MIIYEMPLTKPSPYSVLLSVSLLSILVGTMLAKFRVERQAQLTFHSTFDLLAVFTLVCITGANVSPFSFLFVFVIAASGALLNVAGGLLSAVGASILYALASFIGPHAEILGFENPFTEAETIKDGMFMLIDVGLHAALYIFVGVINGLLSGKLQKAHIAVSELEGELKRLKLETRDILTNIASGIFTCDLKERVLYMNPAARRILGAGDENIVGKPISFLLQERSPNFYRFIQKSIAGRMLPQRSYEFQFRLPNGRSTIIGARASTLRDKTSKKRGVTVICQDISQKRALQEMTMKAQKMELMADISTMLAKEIVPPISMVKNSLRLLATEGNHESRDVESIEAILEQLDGIGRILWDFQGFSRIKVAEWKPVILGDVVRETFDLLKHHPEFSQAVQIRFQGEERKSLIWGDRELLKQAFMNLFIQSCKKMGRKGLVEVEFFPPLDIQNSKGGAIENGDHMIILIQENGTVISEESIDHLGPSHIPTFFNGNGLRLAIVDKIVAAHMGRFLYEDVEGKGTKFTIMLPVKKPAE
ncbi:MAG: nitrogen regulation protein NR(II) [Candidatus Glassbacteria bacterium]